MLIEWPSYPGDIKPVYLLPARIETPREFRLRQTCPFPQGCDLPGDVPRGAPASANRAAKPGANLPEIEKNSLYSVENHQYTGLRLLNIDR